MKKNLLLKLITNIVNNEYPETFKKKYGINNIEELINTFEDKNEIEIIFVENKSKTKFIEKNARNFKSLFFNISNLFTNDIKDLLLKYLEDNDIEINNIHNFAYKTYKLYLYSCKRK